MPTVTFKRFVHCDLRAVKQNPIPSHNIHIFSCKDMRDVGYILLGEVEITFEYVNKDLIESALAAIDVKETELRKHLQVQLDDLNAARRELLCLEAPVSTSDLDDDQWKEVDDIPF